MQVAQIHFGTGNGVFSFLIIIRLKISTRLSKGEMIQPPDNDINALPEALAIIFVRSKKSAAYKALKIIASLDKKDILFISVPAKLYRFSLFIIFNSCVLAYL